MTSFVSGLLSDTLLENMPFLRSSSWRSTKEDDPQPQLPSRLQTSKLFTTTNEIYSAPPLHMDNNTTRIFVDTPPPYHERSYTQQIVDKIIDMSPSTSSSTAVSKSSSSNTTIVDKKGILQGIKLVEIAIDEYESGNEAIALDIYLSGLDKIIMALPNLKDIKTKEALREKLTNLENRVGIQQLLQKYQNKAAITTTTTINDRMSSSSNNQQPTTSSSLVNNLVEKFSLLSNLIAPNWVLSILNKTDDKQEQIISVITTTTTTTTAGDYCSNSSSGDSLLKFKTLGRATTDIIIQCAVLFKQSPIPGLLQSVFSYFVHLLLWLNQNFQLIEKVQHAGVACIKHLLQADEKYHLHEFASEALYTFISASLKAIVAYKEAPGYLIQQQAAAGQ